MVATEPWLGGRDSYAGFCEDWTFGHSWFFYQLVAPIGCDFACGRGRRCICQHAIKAYLKIHIDGTTKGRCRPIKARAKLGLDYEKHGRYDLDLGSTSVRSIKQAQKWAESLLYPAALAGVYSTYYGTYLSFENRGKLIERFDKELGWHEWFWSFEEYPAYEALIISSSYSDLRIHNGSGSVTLVKKGGYGYSLSTWPTVWDKIRGTTDKNTRDRDEYGPL